MDKKLILDLLGETPDEIARELQSFSDSARALSSDHPRLIDEHPQQWVGLYQGKVGAVGKTFKSVMAQIEDKGLPKDEVIVRFIDKDEMTLIL